MLPLSDCMENGLQEPNKRFAIRIMYWMVMGWQEVVEEFSGSEMLMFFEKVHTVFKGSL